MGDRGVSVELGHALCPPLSIVCHSRGLHADKWHRYRINTAFPGQKHSWYCRRPIMLFSWITISNYFITWALGLFWDYKAMEYVEFAVFFTILLCLYSLLSLNYMLRGSLKTEMFIKKKMNVNNNNLGQSAYQIFFKSTQKVSVERLLPLSPLQCKSVSNCKLSSLPV